MAVVVTDAESVARALLYVACAAAVFCVSPAVVWLAWSAAWRSWREGERDGLP